MLFWTKPEGLTYSAACLGVVSLSYPPSFVSLPRKAPAPPTAHTLIPKPSTSGLEHGELGKKQKHLDLSFCLDLLETNYYENLEQGTRSRGCLNMTFIPAVITNTH